MILAVRTALEEVGDIAGLLEPEERAAIDAVITEAEDTMQSATLADPVNAARERIEALSGPFARRRMERALESGMSGRTLAEIESALAEDEQLDARRGAHEAEVIEEEP